MKRRTFIKFTTVWALLLSSNIVIARIISKNNLIILDEILNIIFPKTSTMPSAREFKALNYLVQNISHKTFDDDDKVLIVDGTKDFIESFPDFLNLKEDEKKELIFRIIKNSSYAKSWISKLTYYGVEAMFSDPIYGGNFEQIGWNSVKHNIGYPRPLKTYGQKI
ncbi:MAG: gluconate 2-dehydrogenase subunit 3 family protein [Arcobacter sp.]|jgi:gluconate 2-dehydrogenase gamma chain|uniref:gluconate 2-dehydrogenase subunit 3 family protein n=1 Tax=Arcobacter sp. TaxID=1872629 RepID=UPI002A763336|nr:gluconate 2-dehydrogenase subunit 3 family protein [Arcobacter sp.]MDY3200059.1 gluconate 2-dehydrogenase subunit 3 family protein [Arcobacter sp.]